MWLKYNPKLLIYKKLVNAIKITLEYFGYIINGIILIDIKLKFIYKKKISNIVKTFLDDMWVLF